MANSLITRRHERHCFALLRRVRLTAQIDFFARKARLQPPAINFAVALALRQLDDGSSAASAYAVAIRALSAILRNGRSSLI